MLSLDILYGYCVPLHWEDPARARARLGNLSYAPGRDVGERCDRPAWRAEPGAAGLSPAGNGKAYGHWRVRMVGCEGWRASLPRLPFGQTEARRILSKWIVSGCAKTLPDLDNRTT